MSTCTHHIGCGACIVPEGMGPYTRLCHIQVFQHQKNSGGRISSNLDAILGKILFRIPTVTWHLTWRQGAGR